MSTGFSSEIGTKLHESAVGQAWGSCYSWAALSSNDSLCTVLYFLLRIGSLEQYGCGCHAARGIFVITRAYYVQKVHPLLYRWMLPNANGRCWWSMWVLKSLTRIYPVSSFCPTYVQPMTTLCPCPIFNQYLSTKSIL